MADPTLSQKQLAAALAQLDQVLVEGDAELKKQPEQLRVLKNLQAELKKLKPGQVPPAKTIALPEVATAFAIESCMAIPARSCS